MKRFTINMENECIDDAKEEIFIDFNDKIDFYELNEFLNNLYDENQDLKLQMERLYEYFMDYLEDEMTPDNFSQMWDIVRSNGELW